MTLEAIETLFHDFTENNAVAPENRGLQVALAALEALAQELMGNDVEPAPKESPMTPQVVARLQKEQALLKTYFPTFHIQCPDDPGRAGAVGTLTTNAGNEYGLWIPLGTTFPNERPEMFVVSPKGLTNRRGKKLAKIGTDAAMHLLAPNEHGHPQICHHNDASWTPNVTLYKVVMKARLWLEAYEMHKTTGKDIDHYLPHM